MGEIIDFAERQKGRRKKEEKGIFHSAHFKKISCPCDQVTRQHHQIRLLFSCLYR